MNTTAKVAVASRSFSKHPDLRREMQARYANVTFNETGRSLSGEELVGFLRGHDMAVTALERLTDELFAALPELKIIGKYGVGLDMIDFAALEKHGVKIGWTGGVNKRSVSELVVSFAIALLHRVPEGHHHVRGGGFKQLKGRQLTGRTVGIIGCGHVGKDLTLLLKAFNCTVLANDILDFPDFYAEHNVQPVGLEELLQRSEVVTLHTPLDDSTRGILNAQRLNLMRRDAVLINIARGGLIDEAELKAMLMDGRLAGAAVDVFSPEPPEDMEFLNLPNVIVTPHIGGSSEEAILAMGLAAIDGLEHARLPSEQGFL
ncbi:MAG: phosphoglycerate dehydrogenase [Desulfovibrio sp.]